MSKTYKQSVKEFQESVRLSLVMLASDPHFQTLVDLWYQGRENMVRDICREGMSQKDIDRLRGAIYFADEVLRNTEVNSNNGSGVRNTSRDAHERTSTS